MIKIYIFADSYKHFDLAIKEYEKRLWKNIEIVKLKPSKNPNNNLVIKQETNTIIEKLRKDKWYKIVLSPKGKNISTEDLLHLISSKKIDFSSLIFIIGWANGLDYDMLKPYINYELSLSMMIMPHNLALLALLEQIYRVGMIEKGSNYHK